MIRKFTEEEKRDIENEIKIKKGIPAGGDFSYVWKYDQQDNAKDWIEDISKLYAHYLDVMKEKEALEEELKAKSDYGLAVFYTMEDI